MRNALLTLFVVALLACVGVASLTPEAARQSSPASAEPTQRESVCTCDGVTSKQTDMVLVKEDGEKKVQSVTYAYTPYGEGEAGEIIHTIIGKHRFQIIRLAEFDMTGAYAEQVTKIIRYMNGTYIKEKFYAIPLDELSKVNKHNAKPKLPFYKKPRTTEQK